MVGKITVLCAASAANGGNERNGEKITLMLGNNFAVCVLPLSSVYLTRTCQHVKTVAVQPSWQDDQSQLERPHI